MASDDLDAPLGLKPAPVPRRPRSPARLYALAAFLVPSAIAVAAFLLIPASGTSPRPPAAIADLRPPSQETTASIKPAEPAPDPDNGIRTRRVGNAKIIEVPVDDGDAQPSGTVVIRDLSPTPEPTLADIADDDLLERSSKGMIPRIGDKGRRPLDAYARPLPPRLAEGPRVALIVTGLGIDEASTSSAITGLPGSVTLAFAPYGTELSRMAAQARRAGHELLLQLPMEPFDYPRTDPGPQTLLTNGTLVQNRDRLYWLMSRFRTYVGVVNFMGARFTSDAAAMTPLLNEIGRRGLLYVDDSTSARSKASELSVVTRTPFIAADLIIDANPDPKAIDARLEELVALARSRGKAIGIATAFPMTVERLAAWSKTAAGKGVTLVPISALVTSPRS